MAKFRIQSHGRLQEWVAEDKSYFTAEGLDYEFLVKPIITWSAGAKNVETSPADIQRGAFESIEDGRGCKRPEPAQFVGRPLIIPARRTL